MKKLIIAVAAAATLAVSFGATAQAGYRHHHYRHSGDAALAAGIGAAALGIIAAGAYANSDPYYERDCWTERRVVYDNWGYGHVRHVRVCE